MSVKDIVINNFMAPFMPEFGGGYAGSAISAEPSAVA
jgi:hypothetical protein